MNTALKMLLILGRGANGTNGVAPTNTVLPAISGTPTVGQTLSVSTGTWTGTPTITYAYQWKRSGVSIGSATASTYLLVNADVGTTITCTVTATNGFGSTAATSAATASVANTWANYVTNTIAPPVWYRCNDVSSPLVNSGSIGSSMNLTATAGTFAQTGQLGAGQAVSADGTNTKYQCANNATVAGYTQWEYVYLINPTSAGEGSAGGFSEWGNGQGDAFPYVRFVGALTSIRASVFNSVLSVEAVSITTTGLSAATWALLFVSYDDAGDRKVHIRKGVGGVVSEFAYSSNVALTLLYRVPTGVFVLNNRSDQTQTFDGLTDEMIIVNRVLSDAERTQLTLLAGV